MDRDIPQDILRLLIDLGPLEAVNILARTCSALAKYVRMRANRMAAPHVVPKRDYHETHMTIARTLPNGTRHKTTEILFDGNIVVAMEYSFGAPTNWQVKDENDIFWGQVGTPYMIYCSNTTISAEFCSISVNVGEYRVDIGPNGDVLMHDQTDDPLFNIDVDDCVGYMIDGRIQPSVIDAWIPKVAEALNIPMGALTRYQTCTFNIEQMLILWKEFGSEFDHMFESIGVS